MRDIGLGYIPPYVRPWPRLPPLSVASGQSTSQVSPRLMALRFLSCFGARRFRAVPRFRNFLEFLADVAYFDFRLPPSYVRPMSHISDGNGDLTMFGHQE